MGENITKTLNSLEKEIGHIFKSPELLIRALTHGSYHHENVQIKVNNERLEFLGDAVLDFIISDILMTRFPEKQEGDLSQMRAAIVNERTLAEISQTMDVGSYLYLGRGEEKSGGRQKPSILASALEAIIAAVYQDSGIEAVTNSIQVLFKDALNQVEESFALMDYKSTLQQYFQARHQTTPQYEVIGEAGPDHRKEFEVKIFFDQKELARGMGSSKKEAEQQAAKQALETIQI